MALPTLNATFASAADLPRRQMLAKWLVEELGETQAPSSALVSGLSVAPFNQYNGIYRKYGTSNGRDAYIYYVNGVNSSGGFAEIAWGGESWYLTEGNVNASSQSDVEYPWLATGWFNDDGFNPTGLVINESPAPSPISNYSDLPERYLWAKIAVAAGAPRSEADYISLPKQYVWKAIYDSVSGSSAGTTDWSEKQALGRIAAAYRGDTGNPANLATYIDWPWRYKVASIITSLTEQEPLVDYLYIASGVGLSPNINGFRFYDSGLTQSGQPIYYDETNVYWLTYIAAAWIIAPIGTIGSSGLFFKTGSINPIGLYFGSNGYTGNVTMATI